MLSKTTIIRGFEVEPNSMKFEQFQRVFIVAVIGIFLTILVSLGRGASLSETVPFVIGIVALILLIFTFQMNVVKFIFRDEHRVLEVHYFRLLTSVKVREIPYSQLQLRFKKENVERGVYIHVLRIFHDDSQVFKVQGNGNWDYDLLNQVFLKFNQIKGL